MSLSEELEELQRQRTAEVRNLHSTYLRTKRDVLRAASPARFVRKHLTLSLAAGAALGLLLAPRPSPRPMSEEAIERAVRKAHGRGGGRGISVSWAKRMVLKFFPQAAEYLPDDAEVAKTDEKIRKDAKTIHEEMNEEGTEEGKPGRTQGAGALMLPLEALVPLLASKIDWRSLVNQVMHGAYAKMREPKHNGHEPQVSVADAGTVKPQDFEHFE